MILKSNEMQFLQQTLHPIDLGTRMFEFAVDDCRNGYHGYRVIINNDGIAKRVNFKEIFFYSYALMEEAFRPLYFSAILVLPIVSSERQLPRFHGWQLPESQ